MLGIGPTELIVVAILFLVIFGPSRMPQMARDIGKFVNQARGAIDEFKDELTAETPDDSDRPTRSREEGSKMRKSSQNQVNGSSRNGDQAQAEGDYDEQPPEREHAEYDL